MKYCYLFKMCSVIILIQMYTYASLNVSKEDYNYTNLCVHANLWYYVEEKTCYQNQSDPVFLHERMS